MTIGSSGLNLLVMEKETDLMKTILRAERANGTDGRGPLICLSVPFILSALYLLMIKPGGRKRGDRRPLGTGFFAHRGLHDNEKGIPENSLKAFEKAASAGYGIELDVRLTKDGIPVVFHDEDLCRMCGIPYRVKDLTLPELKEFCLLQTGERIPTLREALDLINGRVRVLVELKMDFGDFRLCEETDRVLRRYRGSYYVQSFNPQALLWYRKNRPGILRGILSDGFIHLEEHRKNAFGLFFLEMLMANFIAKPDFISYNHEFRGNPSRVICAKLFRCPSAGWVIRDIEEFRRNLKAFDVYIFEGFEPKLPGQLPAGRVGRDPIDKHHPNL